MAVGAVALDSVVAAEANEEISSQDATVAVISALMEVRHSGSVETATLRVILRPEVATLELNSQTVTLAVYSILATRSQQPQCQQRNPRIFTGSPGPLLDFC